MEDVEKRAINVIPPLQAKVLPSHPANHEIHGFMPGRKEFEVEHENEAEVPVKDMIFNEDDGPTEIDLKVTLLEIYNSKLDRRQERKQFIFDRGLLEFKKIQAAERKKTKEEKDVHQQMRMFARLMTAEDFNNFVAGLLAEDQVRSRIAQLQEYRRNGITTFLEAETYEKRKKARFEAIARSPFAATSDRLSARHLNRLSSTAPVSTSENTGGAGSQSKRVNAPAAPLDLTGCDGIDSLTASEQELCSVLRILPRAYLSIKETLIREQEKRGGLKRREIRELVRIDVNKLGKIYDFFVSKGWIYANVNIASLEDKLEE